MTEPGPAAKRPPIKTAEQLDMEADEDDSLDEQNELTRVKIGKIPYGWYDEFKNFGYDNKLQPVAKDKKANKIEQFIHKSENKDWWRTIRDELNMRDIVLTDQQLALIDRIRSGKMASKTIANTDYHFDIEHADPFPVNAVPPAKRNFQPSKWERMKVNKILDGLLSGRIPWDREEDEDKKEEELFDAWASGTVADRGVINIAPMKQKLPDHRQSYNPPKQFLLTPEQLKQWQEMDEEDRKFNFVPQAFEKIRKIPFYDKLIQERFQRCLDLYLCPRVKKKKLNIDPDSLIPKLPDPKLLKPFPTNISITYEGHEGSVLCLAVSVSGEYLATGDDKGLLIVWDVLTSRKLFTKKYDDPIYTVDWSVGNLLGFSHGNQVEVMLWKFEKKVRARGQELLVQGLQFKEQKKDWSWYEESSNQYKQGLRVNLKFANEVTHLEFEKSKGDYFLTVCPDNEKKNEVISIHRVSQSASENNFIKGGSIIKKVHFYPKKPHILILTNSKVVYFNLEKLEKIKQLSGTNTYSCMSVHPEGGYIIVGAESQKILCYDLDLSSKPFKSMQYHQQGVTSTHFHPSYPLMASASNDGSVHIFHFKVDNETLNDAAILPLKVLKGHAKNTSEGVKEIRFHPKQPWIFSCAADKKVILWM